MGTHAQLTANPVSASNNTEVAQDNEHVPTRALAKYKFESDVEHLFSSTYLGGSVSCNKRHEAQNVLQFHS